MASKKLPLYVDLIRRHGSLWARNSCGLHVPIETLDEEEMRLAAQWMGWVIVPARCAVAVESVRP